MAQSAKKESRRRSRAITAIIKVIGRDFWNTISTNEKNKRIKKHISETKIKTKLEREEMKKINREYKGAISA